jgi:hypothetical protein
VSSLREARQEEHKEKNHARVAPLKAGSDGQDPPQRSEREQSRLPSGRNDA